MSLSGWLLRMAGWSVEIDAPDFDKCIICVAPHTSNWDFIIGKLAYTSVGRPASFLMKSSWFFFPLGCFFRAIGGIPVVRETRGERRSLVDSVVEMFREKERLTVAITPEGTRSRTDRWHTGFLHIAAAAGVPIVLGVLDYEHKRVIVRDVFTPTGDTAADMRAIKAYYAPFRGKYPEKFSTDPDV